MALKANGLQTLLSCLKKVIDTADLKNRVDLTVCLIRSIDLLLTEFRELSLLFAISLSDLLQSCRFICSFSSAVVRNVLHRIYTVSKKGYHPTTNGNFNNSCPIPVIGSRPSDHYFRSVCLSVCLFVCLFVVQSFSQPSLIRFRSHLDICYMSGSSCVP